MFANLWSILFGKSSAWTMPQTDSNVVKYSIGKTVKEAKEMFPKYTFIVTNYEYGEVQYSNGVYVRLNSEKKIESDHRG